MDSEVQDLNEDFEKSLEDEQVLIEVAMNERIVTHPTKGDIRLHMPTLATQQKIDRVVRTKKKSLMAEKVEVQEDFDSDITTLQPAYKSKRFLEREYEELGWWSPQQTTDIKEAETKMLGLVATLELLGFDSQEDLYQNFLDCRSKFKVHFTDAELDSELSKQILLIIDQVTTPGGDFTTVEFDLLKNNAVNTDVDDLLEKLQGYVQQFDSYLELIETQVIYTELQKEYLSLFSDSWQEQLQYYLRLAQLYFCTEWIKTGKPLWENISAIEHTNDQDFVNWTLTELTAFWQGLTDEARDRLGKYSFMPRQTEEVQSTEDLPDLPQSNEDGESQEDEQTTFLEVTDIQEASPSTN